MNVTEEAYGEMTRRIVECADRHCRGRVLSLLEGGYDLEGTRGERRLNIWGLSHDMSEHGHNRTQQSRPA